VVGDHAQFSDGKAVISSAGTHGLTCFVAYQFYVMAQMCLEINTAGGYLENLTCAIFRNRVVAIRSTQATRNVGLVRRAASVGGLRFHLGFDFAVGPCAEYSRVVQRLNFRPGNLEHPEWNSTNSI